MTLTLLASAPAFPASRFADFKDYVIAETADPKTGWPAGAPSVRGASPPPWRWEDATAVAVSVADMLGAFGVVSALGSDLEDAALCWWLARFNTDEWLANSRKAMLLAEQHYQPATAFAFDSPTFGFDQASWDGLTGDQVRRLNSWCEHAISAFYAAHPPDDAPVYLVSDDPALDTPEPLANVPDDPIHDAPEPPIGVPADNSPPDPAPYPIECIEIDDPRNAPPVDPRIIALQCEFQGGQHIDWKTIATRVCEACKVPVGTSGYSPRRLRWLAADWGLHKP